MKQLGLLAVLCAIVVSIPGCPWPVPFSTVEDTAITFKTAYELVLSDIYQFDKNKADIERVAQVNAKVATAWNDVLKPLMEGYCKSQNGNPNNDTNRKTVIAINSLLSALNGITEMTNLNDTTKLEITAAISICQVLTSMFSDPKCAVFPGGQNCDLTSLELSKDYPPTQVATTMSTPSGQMQARAILNTRLNKLPPKLRTSQVTELQKRLP
jgi:hypothetical protein